MIPYADVGLNLGSLVWRKDLMGVFPLLQFREGAIESAQTTRHRSGPVERSPGPDSVVGAQLIFQLVVRLDTPSG